MAVLRVCIPLMMVSKILVDDRIVLTVRATDEYEPAEASGDTVPARPLPKRTTEYEARVAVSGAVWGEDAEK